MISLKQFKHYAKNKKILIVDDDKITRMSLEGMLDNFFGTIVTAVDGVDGLAKYEEVGGSFDVVISDINMPNMGGIELSKKLKEINSNQPIIITSGSDDSDVLIQLIDIGVDGFAIKPFSFEQLAQRMINILETITYKEYIEDIKRAQIIEDYKKGHDVQSDGKPHSFIHHSHIKAAKISLEEDKNTIKESKSIVEVTDPKNVKTARDLYSYLVRQDGFDSRIIGAKYANITILIQELENSISDLIIIAENIDYTLGNENAETTLEDITRKFSEVYYAINDFSILSSIADGFYEMHEFFSVYKNFDELSPDEVEGLISIDFILQDIKRFVDTVFIHKTSDNIFIYDKLFKANIEQLEANISNAKYLDSDEEPEDAEDELEFF